METAITQKRIDEKTFLEMRKEVLAQWPTGKEVDLDEGVEYNRSQPDSKNFMKATQRVYRTRSAPSFITLFRIE